MDDFNEFKNCPVLSDRVRKDYRGIIRICKDQEDDYVVLLENEPVFCVIKNIRFMGRTGTACVLHYVRLVEAVLDESVSSVLNGNLFSRLNPDYPPDLDLNLVSLYLPEYVRACELAAAIRLKNG